MSAAFDPRTQTFGTAGQEVPVDRAQHQGRVLRWHPIEVAGRADLGAEPGGELLQTVVRIEQGRALQRVGHLDLDPFGVEREPHATDQQRERDERGKRVFAT